MSDIVVDRYAGHESSTPMPIRQTMVFQDALHRVSLGGRAALRFNIPILLWVFLPGDPGVGQGGADFNVRRSHTQL